MTNNPTPSDQPPASRQGAEELDAILKAYADVCIETGLNAYDGNLETVALPNRLTLKAALSRLIEQARIDELDKLEDASYYGAWTDHDEYAKYLRSRKAELEAGSGEAV